GGPMIMMERDDKVSMELTDEVFKSMEVGLAFRDYISTYNVKPVISKGTLEASFSPDGMYVVSGESI
ncbi:hypothetical protein B296_00055365, partial [Ensete ventricosum]